MTMPFATPLLGPGSPLDERSRRLILELYEREATRLKELAVDSPLNPVRRRRVEITRAEIERQPDCFRNTISSQQSAVEDTASALLRRPPKRVYMTGCGDSLAVMIAARPLLEEMFKVPCEPVQALDMAYYFNRPVDSETLVIGLSSSGVTPRTVEAMIMAKALRAQTLVLSNTPGSTLMQEADHALLVSANRQGWPTQASTAALGLLDAFAMAYGRKTDATTARIDELTAALMAVPAQIADTIRRSEPAIESIAKAEAERSMYLFCGGGPSFACAFFGAAKVKECTPDHAMAIPIEEYHHYQSQKLGDPLFLVAPNGLSVPRARDTAEEGLRNGGQVYVVAAEDNPVFDDLSTAVIRLPPMIERLSPLVYTVPLQLFAYHVGMAKFRRAEATQG